jgi:hypothetical protein
MNSLDALGRTILMLGGLLVALGLVLLVLGRVPFVGRLPGDFHLRWGSVSCYFPLMTGVVVSVAATLILNLLLWLLRK